MAATVFVLGGHQTDFARNFAREGGDLFSIFSETLSGGFAAADIDPAQLPQAPPGLRELPWTGPTVIAASRPQGNEEMMRSLDLALQGQEISLRPERWVDYESLSAAALQAARPVALLLAHYPEATEPVRATAQAHGLEPSSLRFVPVVSRKASAVALLGGPQGQVLGFVAVDGFI